LKSAVTTTLSPTNVAPVSLISQQTSGKRACGLLQVARDSFAALACSVQR
jgi:hypothetical protein